jgi:hypothetical protein
MQTRKQKSDVFAMTGGYFGLFISLRANAGVAVQRTDEAVGSNVQVRVRLRVVHETLEMKSRGANADLKSIVR